MKKKLGLFIGRFQPFHNGHLSAIRQAIQHVDLLHIGIGSAQYSHTKENPFSAQERKEMIHSSLLQSGITEDQFDMTFIPDINDFPAWPAHVRALTGDFEILFTGSDIVRELFEKHDHVKIITPKIELSLSATQIRTKIKTDDDWKKEVPLGTKEVIQKINGVKRIKEIFNPPAPHLSRGFGNDITKIPLPVPSVAAGTREMSGG